MRSTTQKLTAILEAKLGVGMMGIVFNLPPENLASRLRCTLSARVEEEVCMFVNVNLQRHLQ